MLTLIIAITIDDGEVCLCQTIKTLKVKARLHIDLAFHSFGIK